MTALLNKQRKLVRQKGQFALVSLGTGVLLWFVLPGWLGTIALVAGLIGAGKWGWDWWRLRSQWGMRL